MNYSESSKITNSKLTKNTGGGAGGNVSNFQRALETDYDEAIVDIEYSNLSKEEKEMIVKVTMNAISK